MFLRPLALLLLVASNARAKLYEDLQADAIIVEADPVSSRDGRQLHLPTLLFPQIYQVTRQVPTSSHNHAHCILKPASNNSKTGKHTPETGICRGVNECYKYFKLPRLSYADTYVMGDYNTCSYVTPLGKQIFGVCCNQTEEELTKSEEVVIDVDIRGLNFHRDRFTPRDPWGVGWGALLPALGETNLDTKIVNGVEAMPHEFPFMAALMNHNRQFCGGSLIDNLHVLTAAHCVAHMSTTDVRNLRIRLGDHDIKTSSEARHVEMKVRRVVRHKKFSSKTLHYDVAILTLERPVEYSSTIQPIELAAGSNKFVGLNVTVAGWGTLRAGGIQPPQLMKVSVDVWTNRKCKNNYGNNAPGGITDHMLCAAGSNKDSCSGDSGGPLFTCPDDGGRCIQVGIVSWGIGCADPKYPGVYSRVSELLPWINRITDEYF